MRHVCPKTRIGVAKYTVVGEVRGIKYYRLTHTA